MVDLHPTSKTAYLFVSYQVCRKESVLHPLLINSQA